MVWWDWKTRKRLALLGAMLGAAAVPWIVVSWVANDWRAFLGGTAFLLIPQMVGWMLVVGLATGRMPSAYGRSELRAESPTWFWGTGVLYVGLLMLFFWIFAGVVTGASMWGF